MDEFKQKVREVSNEYGVDPESTIVLLSPYYHILEAIKLERKKAIRKDTFEGHIRFTKETFLALNNFIENDGYVKLSKRCDLLLKEFEKYKKGGKINPKIKRYFDEIFDSPIPTTNNVISIAVGELWWNGYFKYNREHCKDFVADIFNRGKFNISLKYKYIKIIDKNDTLYQIPSRERITIKEHEKFYLKLT